MLRRLSIALLLGITLLFTGCRAYTLTDELPVLIAPQTQLPEITAIEVTRAADGCAVTLTEIDDLNNMMLQIDGIRGTKTKEESARFTETYPVLYTIDFYKEDTVLPTLYICGEEEFYLNGYSWLAVRGGMDLWYLDSLFPAAE